MRLLSLKNASLLFIILATILLAVFFFVARGNEGAGEYQVKLQEDGFFPEKITISKGDRVIFTTKREEFFWPASNLHPTHIIYPEFDPREPIAPDQSWSIQFNRIGIWKYHDHLAPVHRGEITVLEKGSAKESLPPVDACKDESKEKQCWENIIEETLQKKGVGAAFDVIEGIYTAQPDCHDYAHLIGEEAYRLFSAGEDMELTPKTYYCGYGFYHGFMETLLHTTGNMEEARHFCSYVKQQLSQQVAGAEAACYHGIGHGAVDGGDPRDWGDIEAMIKPGIELCEMVAKTEFQLYICSTGVFNAIDILSQDPKYKLAIVTEDPFLLCGRQPGQYKEACYTNMLPPFWRGVEKDFPRIALRVESIEEKESDYSVRSATERMAQQGENYRIRSIVISALFHEYAKADLKKAKESVQVCRSLKDPRSRLPCIDGLSGAFMKHGEPNAEYIKGLQFCNVDILSEDEEVVCFEHILSRLRLWYSSDKTNQICQSVPEKYKKLCIQQT